MKSDARKLSSEQQELLRTQAIRLREEGMSFQKIGSLLSVHADTVGRWYRAWLEEGEAAIAVKKRGPKKGPRRLTEAQEQRVIEAITDQMPDQYKLGFALWTRRSIAQLIKQFWGVSIPERTMGDLPEALGVYNTEARKEGLGAEPSQGRRVAERGISQDKSSCPKRGCYDLLG